MEYIISFVVEFLNRFDLSEEMYSVRPMDRSIDQSVGVELGAHVPDLAVVAGERADGAHLHHGGDEVPLEPARRGAEVGRDEAARGVAGVERGVRGDDGEAGADVAEDGVVEVALAAAVQRDARVEVARRAPRLELRQERRRDGRVRPDAAAAEAVVVQPVLHEEARRRADRVRRCIGGGDAIDRVNGGGEAMDGLSVSVSARTCEEDEVAVVEAAGGEPGAEHLDGIDDVRKHVGVAEVGDQPVAPPRRHVERRPARLTNMTRRDTHQTPISWRASNTKSLFSMLTMAMASRAASAMMSAQETTPGHWSSSSALAASTTACPRSPWCLLLFTSASFRALRISTDASHPCTPRHATPRHATPQHRQTPRRSPARWRATERETE
ncbi:Os12g0191400 [Oryza sativa Japonica Group]|uniref:Os12g0191400 protein n=1 Tax=Oryza sativa subsp. japonica TaxID=39947 RepID=A0A0P0Y7R0_ORYSJ|nr:hypothetical protein EE612_058247 [Oryza sativa]BAT16209.1 Os12g0191400 [Oryza sativa Japonica Group]